MAALRDRLMVGHMPLKHVILVLRPRRISSIGGQAPSGGESLSQKSD
ncbi:MAG: hypothetical protein AAB824_02365 [Patescibacteria group bacterium]